MEGTALVAQEIIILYLTTNQRLCKLLSMAPQLFITSAWEGHRISATVTVFYLPPMIANQQRKSFDDTLFLFPSQGLLSKY